METTSRHYMISSIPVEKRVNRTCHRVCKNGHEWKGSMGSRCPECGWHHNDEKKLNKRKDKYLIGRGDRNFGPLQEPIVHNEPSYDVRSGLVFDFWVSRKLVNLKGNY